MPVRRSRRSRRRRQRGGQVQHPPGGPPIDVPIAIDVPVAAVPQYRRPKMNLLTRAKAFVKRHKLVSRGLRAVGARSLADTVSRLDTVKDESEGVEVVDAENEYRFY